MRATLAVEAAVGWSRRPSATTQPFVVLAAVLDTVTAGTPFLAWGYNGGVSATFTEAAALVQDAQTLTSWSIQFTGSALAGAETITAAIVIDGVVDATMPIAIVAGETGGVASGTLAIPAGSLVAVRVTLGGGLVSKTCRGCVFALDGPIGTAFFVTATSTISTFTLAHSLYGGVTGGTAGTGGDYTAADASSNRPGGVVHPLPGAVALTGLAAHTREVTAAALAFDGVINDGASAGTATVGFGDQDADATLTGATWPAVTGSGTVNAARADIESDGGDAVLVQLTTRYAPAAPYAAYSIVASPLSVGRNLGASAGNADFVGLPVSDIVSVLPGSIAQFRWPNLPGTFQYLVGLIRASTFSFGDPAVDFSLEVNGVNEITATLATFSANPGYARNDIDSIHVVSGDLVQFAVQHDGPYGGNSRWAVLVGFLPD